MVDPVCGMEVTAESEWKADYEGKTYYFCSQTCMDQFMADPMKYVQAMAQETKTEAGM
ncbi:MAG: YHS domain-containing protein [Armatimonadetes bacterium]|nr:YHS domain-containing protein [Armatimonadota bacterium]